MGCWDLAPWQRQHGCRWRLGRHLWCWWRCPGRLVWNAFFHELRLRLRLRFGLHLWLRLRLGLRLRLRQPGFLHRIGGLALGFMWVISYLLPSRIESSRLGSIDRLRVYEEQVPQFRTLWYLKPNFSPIR
jgi:hypothetical protein